MMDQFRDYPITLTSPATNAAAVTPDDVALLGTTSRAVFVGQPGDLAVQMQGGQSVTLPNVQGGSLLALRVVKVLQTGTTAAGIVALW